jgi:hypothetical protein
MSYKAVTRIITGTKQDGFDYIERGESVTASKVGGQDALDELIASKSVMESDKFDRTFPEPELSENDAPGTPSNLQQVEGTTLQPEAQPEPKVEATVPVNPADPPEVEGAGTAKGFDIKGKAKP